MVSPGRTLVFKLNLGWGVLLLRFDVPDRLRQQLENVDAGKQASLLGVLVEEIPTPAELALALWLVGDDNYRNKRLKLIPHVRQGPALAKKLIDGKPVILGKHLPVSFYREENSLVVDMDIADNILAKTLTSLCRNHDGPLEVDLGFVIQGNSEVELPEQMLGAVKLHLANPKEQLRPPICSLPQLEAKVMGLEKEVQNAKKVLLSLRAGTTGTGGQDAAKKISRSKS